MLMRGSGLYTDESPGLKVDPVVVMTLSVVFIFSVVALHGTCSFSSSRFLPNEKQSSPRSCADSPHRMATQTAFPLPLIPFLDTLCLALCCSDTYVALSLLCASKQTWASTSRKALI